MAAREKLSTTEFVATLELLALLSFRYTAIGGKNPSLLETRYAEAAMDVVAGEITTAREIFGRLQEVYGSEEGFVADLSQHAFLGTSGKLLARYILMKLDDHMSNTGRSTDPLADSATIEHIMPLSTLDTDEELRRRPETVHLLGNLLLLESGKNKDLGAQPYADRLPTYRSSGYASTQRFADSSPEEWVPSQIVERTARLARVAAHVWRSPYDTP